MKPTLLLILDGWGLAEASKGNAISLANTPTMDKLMVNSSKLIATGRDVGLPAGYIGNSEVGHLNIGSGRVVYQDLTRIDLALEQGELEKNTVFLDLIKKVKAAGGRLHLAGLLSDAGVHSHINHLIALVRTAHKHKVPVRIHCFMDGRDSSPNAGLAYLEVLQKAIVDCNDCKIATLCGRFYAMDRDKRWDRVELAWKMLVDGQGANIQNPNRAIEDSYSKDVTDEFIKPTILCDDATIMSNDGLFLFNFRADRMRELVEAFILPDFNHFPRKNVPNLAGIATMTSYTADFDVPVAFEKDTIKQGLGEIVSSLGKKQLRIAETEKYPHITYFFNGGLEKALKGEDRLLIASPRDVATYDLKPAMSAYEVTDTLIAEWEKDIYTLVVCNLANSDMVGHTGSLPAAIEACETIDKCVAKLMNAVFAKDGRMIVIADHGNGECMLDENDLPHTAHTMNFVPFIIAEKDVSYKVVDGRLADVAPTILSLWGIEKPSAMTGKSLVE